MEKAAGGLFLSWLGKMPCFLVRLALLLEYMAWADGAAPPEAVGLDALGRALGFVTG